tara:strand:+ start:103 stop:453 length:351 start_codon:yes stop_codon:yes gene_type:complete
MATRVITLQEPSGEMLDEIFRKKPTFKEIYPKIDANLIEIVKGIIEIDTNQGIKRKTVEMWTDEEAKLKDKSVNVKATMAYQMYNKKKFGNANRDTINGSVAVIIPNYEQFEVESL